MSTREPERPSEYGDPELELLEQRLTEWLDRIRQARAYTAKRGPLFVFKAATLSRGLYCWERWIESLAQSMNAAAAGRPFNVESQKTRPAAKKVAEKRKRYARKKS